MTKIVDFIKARLDADDALAKAATPGPWRVGRDAVEGGWEVLSDVPSNGYEVAGSGWEGGGVWERADADYIARHDPNTTLRTNVAIQRILGQYEMAKEIFEVRPTMATTAAYMELKRAVLAIASIWGTHKDYDESWGQWPKNF